MKRLIVSAAVAATWMMFGAPLVGIASKDLRAFASFSASESRAASPPAYIRGRLTCALNVNRFLRKLGRRGTNSASSHSFKRCQRVSASRALPGDVVFNSRGKGGGHAQVFASRGLCWNPSASRQRWVLQSCNASHRRKAKSYWRCR